MADFTESVTYVTYLGLLTSAVIALIPGLVVHAFIISVNVNDWWKGRSVTAVDHIITSLGISRMCAQCVLTLYLFVYSLRKLNSLLILVIIGRVYAFFNYASFWLTSFLSIIFCLKISNLQTRLFLYLRRMIVQRTGYFIIVSVLLMSLSTAITDITRSGTYNRTRDNHSTDCSNMIHFMVNFIIGAIIPLLFYCISSVLLFTSLYHHTTRMKMSSNLTINLQTYYSVMRFVSFTFIYNTIYFTGQVVAAVLYYFYCVRLPWLYVFLDFLQVLHSSYLIYKTAKLRNQMSKVLRNIVGLIPKEKCRNQRKHRSSSSVSLEGGLSFYCREL